LKKSVSIFEGEKKEMKKKLNSMEAYINQMEEALCHELKRRRQIENDHKSLQKETKTLAHNFKTKIVKLEKAKRKIKIQQDSKSDTLKYAGVTLLFKTLDSSSKRKQDKAFRIWACETSKSRTISNQMGAARQIADQLETTKEKIFALKSHFKEEELLNEENSRKSSNADFSPY
jgi:hypothetical protein